MKIPANYCVKSKFEMSGARFNLLLVMAVPIAVVFFWIFSAVGGLDLVGFISIFNSPIKLFTLFMALLFFLYLHGYLHEKVHQYIFRRYGIKTTVNMNFLLPNNTLPVGEGCSRNVAVLATLGPLVILQVLGLGILFVPCGEFMAYVVFFLSANVGMAAVDIVQSVWMMKHPKHYLFGYDGKDCLMYGP